MKTITFNSNGHDDFIDFIKAYAIICVLFGHTFLWLGRVGYAVWAGMQVPLFLLVQTFHCYKKEKQSLKLGKIIRRVLLPFLFVEVLTFILALLFTDFTSNELVTKLLSGWGLGPGAYYPWIYLQAALLLPLFGLLLRSCNKTTALILFLLICEGFEVLFSVVDFPDRIYRLLCVRYIFLFYLGWLWVKDGICINWVTILLSILSLASILYFEYISANDEPWFYTTSWKYHRWPCYFFVANGFISLLHALWQWIRKREWIRRITKTLATASYEIFLLQMMLIFLIKKNGLPFGSFKIVQYITWVLLIWGLSISGGIIWNKIAIKNRH